MSTKHSISWPYLLGLLETDGSFHILLKADQRMPLKYRVQPEIQWSQKDVHVLQGIEGFLSKRGIRGKYKNNPSFQQSGRAPVVKIEGLAECQKFLLGVEGWVEENGCAPLLGCKYVDYLLMQKTLSIVAAGKHNSREGRCQIIDLRYALHKPPAALKKLEEFRGLPIPTPNPLRPNQLSREEWERRQRLLPGESRGSAGALIAGVHDFYVDFARHPQKLHPEFFSGVIQGDGCFYARRGQNPIFTITVERGSELLLWGICATLGDSKPSLDKRGTFTVYKASRLQLTRALYNHLLQHPPIFNKLGFDLSMSLWGERWGKFPTAL